MKNVQTDGKQFLIPRTRYTIRAGIAIRNDWLDNLGLEMPETIDEFHEILRAFTFDDPDENGVDDTYGLFMYDQGLKNFGTQLSIYMGGPNNYKVGSDGNMTIQYDTEEYTRALTWFHDCYAEDLINKDFPVVNDKTSNFTNGYTGAIAIPKTSVKDLLNSNAKYAVFDPTLPFISEAETEMGGTLGELTIDGWKEAIQTWKKMGGEQVVNEYSDQYKQFN